MKTMTTSARLIAIWIAIESFACVTAQAQETVTVVTTGDTYIQANSDTGTGVNYGDETLIKVNFGANPRQKGYIKFSLAGQNPDPEASAVVTLYVNLRGGHGTGTPIEVRGLKAGYTGTTDWNEMQIRWGGDGPEAPANDSFNSFSSTETSTLHSGAYIMVSEGFTGAWSVTINRLGDYLQADGTVTILLRVNNPDWNYNTIQGRHVHFASKEHATQTEPRLTFMTLPASGTVFMLR